MCDFNNINYNNPTVIFSWHTWKTPIDLFLPWIYNCGFLPLCGVRWVLHHSNRLSLFILWYWWVTLNLTFQPCNPTGPYIWNILEIFRTNIQNLCTFSGWWFGCHFLYFPIYWVSNHPNWRTPNWVAQPPTSFVFSPSCEIGSPNDRRTDVKTRGVGEEGPGVHRPLDRRRGCSMEVMMSRRQRNIRGVR